MAKPWTVFVGLDFPDPNLHGDKLKPFRVDVHATQKFYLDIDPDTIIKQFLLREKPKNPNIKTMREDILWWKAQYHDYRKMSYKQIITCMTNFRNLFNKIVVDMKIGKK